MKVVVKFFGKHKEIVGIDSMEVEIEKGKNVEHLFEALCKKFPHLRDTKNYTIISVNNHYASFKEILHDGDNIAFFPPVGGG